MHINKNVSLGSVIQSISVYGGDRYVLSVSISQVYSPTLILNKLGNLDFKVFQNFLKDHDNEKVVDGFTNNFLLINICFMTYIFNLQGKKAKII